MDQPRLWQKVAALSSSLILVTGYVSYRAGVLRQSPRAITQFPTHQNWEIAEDQPFDQCNDDAKFDSPREGNPAVAPLASVVSSTIFEFTTGRPSTIWIGEGETGKRPEVVQAVVVNNVEFDVVNVNLNLASPTRTESFFERSDRTFREENSVIQVGAVQESGNPLLNLQAKLADFGGAQPSITVMAGSKSGVGIFLGSDLLIGQEIVTGQISPTTPAPPITSPVFPEVMRRLSPEPPQVQTLMAGSKSIVMTWNGRVPTTRDYALNFFNQFDKNKNGTLNRDELPKYVWEKLVSMDAITDDYVNWRVLEERFVEFHTWFMRQK